MRLVCIPMAIALAASAAGQSLQCNLPHADTSANADRPVATVNGQPIYDHDLATATAGQMIQLRNQEYQARRKALEDVIRQRIVEAEAAKRGLTADTLYAQAVDTTVPTPSEGEVAAYYLALKSNFNRPLAEIKMQLQANLKALQVQQARQDFADALRTKAEVAILLRPPITQVAYDASRLRGDPKAPITIVEFADYQCPYCKQTETTLKNLLKKYAGQVNIAFREFPLSSIHPFAERAAEAAQCAGNQGKYWEFHDALFDNQSKLDEAAINETARGIGLNQNSFEACVASRDSKLRVARDQEDGKKAGVSATPGFFVGGVFLNGAQPEAEFDKIIAEELARLP
jgi:protein-disulfide isomerase